MLITAEPVPTIAALLARARSRVPTQIIVRVFSIYSKTIGTGRGLKGRLLRVPVRLYRAADAIVRLRPRRDPGGGGRHGRMVPVGDVAAMSRSIREALETPRYVMPSQALASFTLEAALDGYEAVIEDTTPGRRR